MFKISPLRVGDFCVPKKTTENSCGNANGAIFLKIIDIASNGQTEYNIYFADGRIKTCRCFYVNDLKKIKITIKEITAFYFANTNK